MREPQEGQKFKSVNHHLLRFINEFLKARERFGASHREPTLSSCVDNACRHHNDHERHENHHDGDAYRSVVYRTLVRLLRRRTPIVVLSEPGAVASQPDIGERQMFATHKLAVTGRSACPPVRSVQGIASEFLCNTTVAAGSAKSDRDIL